MNLLYYTANLKTADMFFVVFFYLIYVLSDDESKKLINKSLLKFDLILHIYTSTFFKPFFMKKKSRKNLSD